MEPSTLLKSVFLDALEAIRPARLVGRWLEQPDHLQKIRGSDIRVVAFGKASLEMAAAFAGHSPADIAAGLVIAPSEFFKSLESPKTPRSVETPQNQGGHSSPARDHILPSSFDIMRGSHPYPGGQSLQAGRALVDFAGKVPSGGVLIALISGGASSLVCLPAEEIAVGDLSETYRLLVRSGADIGEVNIVRKHLSRIKGGQLLEHLPGSASLVELIISDVPGDDPGTVGSGPTIPDPSSFQDAYHILLERELWQRVPGTVREHIERGLLGEVPDTIGPGEDLLESHESFVIGSARTLAEEVAERIGRKGYEPWIFGEPYVGSVGQVAQTIAEKAKAVAGGEAEVTRPAALIWYGESTVEVTGDGKGGRNQELALWGARAIAGQEHVTWLSAGTDGVDGPTDAAGAIVDGRTIPEAKNRGIDPAAFLEDNDSYRFHRQMDTLLKTGPTGHNLMDLQIVLVG